MGGLTLYNHYVRDRDGNYVKVSTEGPPLDDIHSVKPKAGQTPVPIPNSATESHREFPDTANLPPTKSNETQESPVHKSDSPAGKPPETQLANALLRHFHLADIDSGDLLLLILLFFLFKQKADEELLLAIGLLLIL